MKNTQEFHRKVVLITGSSSGIGAATARQLAADGHRVAIGARRGDRLAALATEIRDAGGVVFAHELDVTSLASVEAFVAAAHQHYGQIDVLVNNAGIMRLAPVDELKIEEWNQMIDVNLRGVLNGIATVLPIMRAQGSGPIVNVASVSTVRALSEGLRQESQFLRVTVVSPGLTRTELFDTRSAQTRAMLEQLAISPQAIADAIAFSIDQPSNVDVNELIIRPTLQGT